jgi:hypothetical protein
MLVAGSASVGLSVKVGEPKVTGGKAYVKLVMKNTFTNTVESARAAVFLTDEQGKVVGQATRWVLGRSAIPAESRSRAPGAGTTNNPQFVLAPDGGQPFFFVVPLAKSVKGPLRARILFDRLNLTGGVVCDATKEVSVQKSGAGF